MAIMNKISEKEQILFISQIKQMASLEIINQHMIDYNRRFLKHAFDNTPNCHERKMIFDFYQDDFLHPVFYRCLICQKRERIPKMPKG